MECIRVRLSTVRLMVGIVLTAAKTIFATSKTQWKNATTLALVSIVGKNGKNFNTSSDVLILF